MATTATRNANELVEMPAKRGPGRPPGPRKAPVVEAVKRPPGRRPGSPKVAGSGRKKHVQDKWRQELEGLFEHNAVELAEFLFKVALGRKVTAPHPNDPTKTIRRICSPELREKCAKTLLAKGWPDLSRVEHTGSPAVALIVNIQTSPPP